MRHDLFLHDVKTGDSGHGIFIEMAMYRILNHLAQLRQGVGFGENGFSERTCDESPFG